MLDSPLVLAASPTWSFGGSADGVDCARDTWGDGSTAAKRSSNDVDAGTVSALAYRGKNIANNPSTITADAGGRARTARDDRGGIPAVIC
jgi:hypothetical protein